MQEKEAKILIVPEQEFGLKEVGVPLREVEDGISDMPVVIIDSQSDPALVGVEAEQHYMRAFLMASAGDLVVTDFKLNQAYLTYLEDVLNLSLPSFKVVSNIGEGTLSGNLLADRESLISVQQWLKDNGGRVQFFNLNVPEQKLLTDLQGATTCGNIESAMQIGSKPGFRKLCLEVGVPMPAGFSCTDFGQTLFAVKEIIKSAGVGLIKSERGTGGFELQSNIDFSLKEWRESGLSLENYVQAKLDFFGELLGKEWVVEEFVSGDDGSVHVFIHDSQRSTGPFILGVEQENNSYVGGYFPAPVLFEAQVMLDHVASKLIPALQAKNVFGYHCFDFKGNYFLEDNVRPGALDFVYQFVARVAEKWFPERSYSWYHAHVPTGGPTSFQAVANLLGEQIYPSNDYFVLVTNPEVLPYGRSLDLTAVSVDGSVKQAKDYFLKQKVFLEGKI